LRDIFRLQNLFSHVLSTVQKKINEKLLIRFRSLPVRRQLFRSQRRTSRSDAFWNSDQFTCKLSPLFLHHERTRHR